MDNVFSFLENLLGGRKFISPLADKNYKGPTFSNGKAPVQAAPDYLTKNLPGESTWIHSQMQKDPNQTAGQLAKTYFTASTAPGGINSEPSPTPTPTPQPIPAVSNIPTKLGKLSQDPGMQYDPIIEKAAEENNIPAPLLKGMLAHESMQFNPKYVGGYHTDGSGRGVAAIDKNAHPEITDDQAFDPSFAIPWAAKTLAGYRDQEGNLYQALQRYNGGGNYNSQAPGYAGVPVGQRTRDYANNVLSQAQHYGTSSVPNNILGTSTLAPGQ